jgi:anthranilate/para-aminobenzoate synthase component I
VVVRWWPVTAAAVLGAYEDPFEVLSGPAAGDDAAGEGPLFVGGGWMGLWGYQLGRHVELLPQPPPRPVPQPDHWLGYYEWVLRQDSEGQWWFESLLLAQQVGPMLARLLMCSLSSPILSGRTASRPSP